MRDHAAVPYLLHAYMHIVANVVSSFSAGTPHIDCIRMNTDAHVSDSQELVLQECLWSNLEGVPHKLWVLANWSTGTSELTMRVSSIFLRILELPQL